MQHPVCQKLPECIGHCVPPFLFPAGVPKAMMGIPVRKVGGSAFAGGSDLAKGRLKEISILEVPTGKPEDSFFHIVGCETRLHTEGGREI